MRLIYVLCEGEGKYSGRLLANHLRRRLSHKLQVDHGSRATLARNILKGRSYKYILNEGAVLGSLPGASRVLNEVFVCRTTHNRRFFRMKMGVKRKRLPQAAPKNYNKLEDVTKDSLPVFGRSNLSSDEKDLWPCFTMADVYQAGREGATHFVERVPDTREFHVHVVAPEPNVRLAKEEDFQVIKISERRSECAAAIEINPAIKSKSPHWTFGEVINTDNDILNKLAAAGRTIMKETLLHWGTVTFIVGKDGKPKVIKVNANIYMKEDRVNTMARFSNAICKMLGEEPKLLIRSRGRMRRPSV